VFGDDRVQAVVLGVVDDGVFRVVSGRGPGNDGDRPSIFPLEDSIEPSAFSGDRRGSLLSQLLCTRN
jgi:hypothetical protein